MDPDLRQRLHLLLTEYGARVRFLIERHGLGQYGIEPDDIEQEVRIRLWRALERDRNAAFRPSYIQRVVLTTVIDAIRSAKSRPSEPLPEAGSDAETALSESRPGPESQAGRAQDFGRVAACLATLPQRRRDAVTLHLQGFSLGEIGRISGTTEEAARKLLDRGMRTLRERLSAAGLGDIDE